MMGKEIVLLKRFGFYINLFITLIIIKLILEIAINSMLLHRFIQVIQCLILIYILKFIQELYKKEVIIEGKKVEYDTKGLEVEQISYKHGENKIDRIMKVIYRLVLILVFLGIVEFYCNLQVVFNLMQESNSGGLYNTMYISKYFVFEIILCIICGIIAICTLLKLNSNNVENKNEIKLVVISLIAFFILLIISIVILKEIVIGKYFYGIGVVLSLSSFYYMRQKNRKGYILFFMGGGALVISLVYSILKIILAYLLLILAGVSDWYYVFNIIIDIISLLYLFFCMKSVYKIYEGTKKEMI